MENAEFQLIHDLINHYAEQYKYRPLPKAIGQAARERYSRCLNGFEAGKRKNVERAHILIANDYERVVVGDYGAYLEIAPEHFVGHLTLPDNQRWRLDTRFIREKNLSVKYEWYECIGAKVYKQLGTVRYADYRPGFYYISVLDLD